MGLLDMFKKAEEVIEIPTEEEEQRKVMVRIEKLKDFVDVDRITRLLREGNIVFLKTQELQRRDIGEFQNCVQKLRRVSRQYGFYY